MDAQTFAKAGEIWFRLECIIELAARRREQQAGSRTAPRRRPGGSKGSGHLLRTPERRLRSLKARGGLRLAPSGAPKSRIFFACLLQAGSDPSQIEEQLRRSSGELRRSSTSLDECSMKPGVAP